MVCLSNMPAPALTKLHPVGVDHGHEIYAAQHFGGIFYQIFCHIHQQQRRQVLAGVYRPLHYHAVAVLFAHENIGYAPSLLAFPHHARFHSAAAEQLHLV